MPTYIGKDQEVITAWGTPRNMSLHPQSYCGLGETRCSSVEGALSLVGEEKKTWAYDVNEQYL